MNANELADKLQELDSKLHLIELFKSATMLRQQQNEIEDLKNANRFIQNFAEEQHQRAVALESELDRAVELYTDKAIENESFDRTASHMAGEYVSHPVKEQDTECQYCKQGCIRCDVRKQLTDEEIDELANKYLYVLNDVPYANDIKDFARAILRKAQDK